MRQYAHAGNYAYSWEYWRIVINEAIEDCPRVTIRCVSRKNGIVFAGYKPLDPNGYELIFFGD